MGWCEYARSHGHCRKFTGESGRWKESDTDETFPPSTRIARVCVGSLAPRNIRPRTRAPCVIACAMSCATAGGRPSPGVARRGARQDCFSSRPPPHGIWRISAASFSWPRRGRIWISCAPSVSFSLCRTRPRAVAAPAARRTPRPYRRTRAMWRPATVAAVSRSCARVIPQFESTPSHRRGTGPTSEREAPCSAWPSKLLLLGRLPLTMDSARLAPINNAGDRAAKARILGKKRRCSPASSTSGDSGRTA